ncbi:hypothetical protein BH10BAC4_BH10BAC4_08260 [soil metagenome]
MKNYYRILRISRQASEEEIKRAYWRLALVFHPDKNQSPESASLFQEINEAYEVLSDQDKKVIYDQLLNASFVSTTVDVEPQRVHRDPAYRRRQTGNYHPKPAQPSERLLLMAYLLRYLRAISLVGIGYCALMILDYSLPFRISNELVVSEVNRIQSWQYQNSAYVIITDKLHQFPVSREGSNYFPEGSHAAVATSRLMNVLVKVESEDKKFTVRSLGSVYSNFLFMPGILLILSVGGLVLKNGLEFRFSFQVAICMFLFFNLIFLSVSIL